MIRGKVITVVMPAYNAEQTLRQTYAEIPFDIVDHVVLVDDASSDHTSDIARELGIRHIIPAISLIIFTVMSGIFRINIQTVFKRLRR